MLFRCQLRQLACRAGRNANEEGRDAVEEVLHLPVFKKMDGSAIVREAE